MTSLIPWRKRGLAKTNGGTDPLVSLRNEMNRLFEDFNTGFDLGPALEPTLGDWVPRINVSETDQEVQVTAELPGMSEKDIDVSLTGEALVLKGDKKEEKEEKGKNYYRSERSYGSFQRVIPLPCDVQADKVEANFKNGVLTIGLPKSKEAKSKTKKIAISAG